MQLQLLVFKDLKLEFSKSKLKQSQKTGNRIVESEAKDKKKNDNNKWIEKVCISFKELLNLLLPLVHISTR